MRSECVLAIRASWCRLDVAARMGERRRLQTHARKLLKEDVPVILAGDYNVAPTEIDIYPTRSWDDDALVQPQSRSAYARLVSQGWTDAIRELHGDDRVYTFWHYLRNRWQRNAGLRLDHLLLSPSIASDLTDAGVNRALRGGEGPATYGSSSTAPAVRHSGCTCSMARTWRYCTAAALAMMVSVSPVGPGPNIQVNPFRPTEKSITSRAGAHSRLRPCGSAPAMAAAVEGREPP